MASPVRSNEAAVKFAAVQRNKPTSDWHNLCLKFVRTCLGVGPREPNAKRGWETAKFRHTVKDSSEIPLGVPVWFQTGTQNWHVVISAGNNGMCYSSDVGGKGKIGYIGIHALERAWGIKLLGWSEDINGVRVYTPPQPAPKPKYPAFPKGGFKIGKPAPSAKRLQELLKKGGFMPAAIKLADNYGPQTQAAVVRFHNKHTQFRSNGIKKDRKIGPKGYAFLVKTYG